MKSLGAILLLSFVSLTVRAKTVVISDIDDTLKESHVSVWWGVPEIKSTAAFWGMPDLLQTLSLRSEIYYVSSAAKSFMGYFHENFLKVNAFPDGDLHLRQGSNDGYKRAQVLDIVAKEKPNALILIGDNGERDPEIYEGLASDLSAQGIVVVTFIHEIYSSKTAGKPIRAGQVSYVTAGEIAAVLGTLGFLSIDEARDLIYVSMIRPGDRWIGREGRYPGVSLGFPDWMDCREHRANIPRTAGFEEAAGFLEAKINARCSYLIK